MTYFKEVSLHLFDGTDESHKEHVTIVRLRAKFLAQLRLGGIRKMITQYSTPACIRHHVSDSNLDSMTGFPNDFVSVFFLSPSKRMLR